MGADICYFTACLLSSLCMKQDRATLAFLKFAVKKLAATHSDRQIAARVNKELAIAPLAGGRPCVVTRERIEKIRQRLGMKKTPDEARQMTLDRPLKAENGLLRRAIRKMKAELQLTEEEWNAFDARVREKMEKAICK